MGSALLMSCSFQDLRHILILFSYFMVDENYYDDIYFQIFGEVLINLDIYSNFICVVLTYSMFDAHYRFCCGCLDRKCRKFLLDVANARRSRSLAKDDRVRHHVTAIELSCESPLSTSTTP